MPDLLTEIKSVSISKEENALKERPRPQTDTPALQGPRYSSTANDALQVLRSQPDRDELRGVLIALSNNGGSKQIPVPDLRKPSPEAAKIINEIVVTSIPDYWTSLVVEHDGNHESPSNRDLLLDCLRNLAGIGAVVARLRLLSAQPENHNGQSSSQIKDLIAVLDILIGHDELARDLWHQLVVVGKNPAEVRLLWREFSSLIASGKIVSCVAQGEDLSKTSSVSERPSWISDASKYASWLGRNIATLVLSVHATDDEQGWSAAAQLSSKCFSFGNHTQLVEAVMQDLLLKQQIPTALQNLLAHLQSQEQAKFIHQALHSTSRMLDLKAGLELPDQNTRISQAASLIAALVGDNKQLSDKIVDWLSDPVRCSNESLPLRRAAFGVISIKEDCVETILESNMKLFGESLFVKHAPMVHQDTCAENLLLAAGILHRVQPMSVFVLARSSTHMTGTSNRLNSSSVHGRVLGMCVAMAISILVDKEGQKMNFDIEDVKTDEAKSLMGLIHVSDKIAQLSDTVAHITSSKSQPAEVKTRIEGESKKPKTISGTKGRVAGTIHAKSGPRVIEILSEDDDDDLVPYSKPDSDPEDDDDDPTLVNRNKPRAPVYIRDLIAGLQDTENYDRHKLAIETAASLIRRKAGFGKEVKDHALELGTILAALGDTFKLEDFAELRLQALIALLLSDPKTQGPWFARRAFDGDYSLSQRATLLSAIGLGARELAGYQDVDTLNPAVTPKGSLPSKRLPERYHNIYAGNAQQSQQTLPPSRLQTITANLERSMIQPLAASAADAATGPAALKVRTFSSRMDVAQRTKKVPNELAKTLAESFFFPLVGHWSTHVQAYGSSRNIYLQPFLLTTYLKTLALLLHASGPGTVNLPQLTAEFWDLLLGVRSIASEDVAVLEAVLFSLLTLLEVNEDKKRLVDEHSRQLVETQEWTELMFSRASSADKEGERVRTLAAGVLVRSREVVEKYQRIMVGDLMDY
ncbi:hypothetical protein MBLNU457_7808t1 [Dothideomycetes sp. NU457]